MLSSRRRRHRLASLLAAGAAFAVPSLAFAGDPAAEFNAWMRAKFESGEPLTVPMAAAKATELLASIDLDALDLDGLAALDRMANYVPEVAETIRTRIAGIAEGTDVDAARAKMLGLPKLARVESAERLAGLTAVFDHPALKGALATAEAEELFDLIGRLPVAEATALRDRILQLSVVFDLDVAPEDSEILATYVSSLQRLGDLIPPAAYDTARTAAAERLRRAVDLMQASGDAEQIRSSEFLDRLRAYLEGAFMRGELLDQPAPSVAFNWYSSGESIHSLEDLRGKVVVLEFWTTGCGFCWEAMPKMRELQARYAGYDVVVLGVTSLQGMHHPGGGGDPIVTRDDPAREYAAMARLIADHDVTWPIAFMTENVLNPDFGVRGVPNMAIIDPAGVVRVARSHPAIPLAAKAAMIDPLLVEAGLTAPARVATPGE